MLLLQTKAVDAEAAKWSNERIPLDGQMGKWALAAGSDLQCLTLAGDGALYCYATPEGTTDTLFRSRDNGISWESIGRVKDIIIDIAVCPQDPNSVYYATSTKVYKSTDGVDIFKALPANPGGAGAGNIQITSIDVLRSVNGNLVVVSTRDTDASQYGGIYLLDESLSSQSWVDLSAGNIDACRVAFSPDYAKDKTIYAVNSNETSIVISAKTEDGLWGSMIGDATIPGMIASTASMSFPGDFASTRTFYIGISTGSSAGDVFRIDQSTSPSLFSLTDLNAGTPDALTQVDINSISVNGNVANAGLLAGCAASTKTYASIDGGNTWFASRKPPTGQANTCVLWSATLACAVTTGTDSAFSVSTDNGLTWNQVSLIDTRINNIVNLAVNQSGSFSPAVYMLSPDTTALTHSLWRRGDGIEQWQRIFSSTLPGVRSLQSINCAPGNGNQTIFLSGASATGATVWISNDTGQVFTERSAPCEVNSMAVLDATTFFIAGFVTGKGVIYRSNDAGSTYLDATYAGTKTICELSISPNFLQDKIILAGNVYGQVFWSNNGGLSFEQIGQQLPISAGIGKVSVAFDSKFAENKTIYAAVDTKVTTTSKERIYRFVLRQSNQWQSIYAGLPDNASVTRLWHAPGGAFYALNSQPVNATDHKGGLLRSLSASDPSFETVNNGLDEAVTLYGLCAGGSRFWAIDTKNNAVLSITDNLTNPVYLTSPLPNTNGVDIDVTLEWFTANGATEYQWQVSKQANFGNVPSANQGTCSTITTQVSGLEPGTTYYWRVRADKPFLSPWSTSQTFTTILGGKGIGPNLNQPANGATTGLKPIFQWLTVKGADRYELVVAKDATFMELIHDFTGEKALLTNAWQCDKELEYNSAYFWKVRARTETNYSAWSEVNAFITSDAPVQPTTPETANIPIVIEMPTQEPAVQPTQQINIIAPENPTPTYSPTNIFQFSIPQWAIFTFLGMLGVIVLLILTLILLVVKMRR
ncbi:MAG: hypothetical protein PHE50_01395 [Dehalococcoidales bacterium]|nr:hypothetical protein [Dehalococcoidales bacterium]